jgi:hypothetical protein
VRDPKILFTAEPQSTRLENFNRKERKEGFTAEAQSTRSFGTKYEGHEFQKVRNSKSAIRNTPLDPLYLTFVPFVVRFFPTSPVLRPGPHGQSNSHFEIRNSKFFTYSSELEVVMERQHKSRNGNIGIVLCLIILFVGLIISVFVPTISDTTRVVLLGGGLLVVGIWGRRTFKQE